jgi:hypothetical protein
MFKLKGAPVKFKKERERRNIFHTSENKLNIHRNKAHRPRLRTLRLERAGDNLKAVRVGFESILNHRL